MRIYFLTFISLNLIVIYFKVWESNLNYFLLLRTFVILLNIIIILIIYNSIEYKKESRNCRSIYLFHSS